MAVAQKSQSPLIFITTFHVLERHKIRLPADLCLRLPALAQTLESVPALAIPGIFGGIQILFGDAPFLQQQKRVDGLVRRGMATEANAGKDWTLLARLSANV